MKRCPECSAEYDDYVEYCFVDGAELVAPARARPPRGPSAATAAMLPWIGLLAGFGVASLLALVIVIAMILFQGPETSSRAAPPQNARTTLPAPTPASLPPATP